MAAEIIRRTGLHVDVVAGSSPQKVSVYIPGSGDGKVDALDYVEEQWTKLGAAATIQSGIDSSSLTMLGATGAAGMLYLVAQSILATLARRRELALLQAVGWERRHISGLLIGEAAVTGAVAGLCATLLALLLAWNLGLFAPIEQAAGIGLLLFVLYVASAVGPALWIVRQPVADLLRRGEVAPSKNHNRATVNPALLRSASGANTTGWRGLARYSWRNMMRRRLRALLAVSGVAVATTLMLIVAAALAAVSGVLRVTLLGQFMVLEVQPYHYIMVGSALIISILTVANHLAMGVLERRHELFLLHAVG